MHIREGRGTNACSKRRRIKLVLGIENERDIHYLFEKLARGVAAEHMKEMTADRGIIESRFNSHAVVREAIPVTNDGWEQGE